MRTISFVAASSNSGKTTLIEKVVRILKSRGFRVAAIKHTSTGFDLDKPGKDSWRFQRAGADAVVLIGPDNFAVIKKVKITPDLPEIERVMEDIDIVIKEGFKKDTQNKIEVFRSSISGEQPLALHDPSYIALVTDLRYNTTIPQFDLNDAEGIASFILDYFNLKPAP